MDTYEKLFQDQVEDHTVNMVFITSNFLQFQFPYIKEKFTQFFVPSMNNFIGRL